jgi:hypothetical protein
MFGALAALLATFFGIILLSAKVVDLSVNSSAASTQCQYRRRCRKMRFLNMVSSLSPRYPQRRVCAATSQQPQWAVENSVKAQRDGAAKSGACPRSVP